MVPRLSVDTKISILSSDSLLLPIHLRLPTVGQDPAILTQVVYLVHLRMRQMSVTVFTAERFAKTKVEYINDELMITS